MATPPPSSLIKLDARTGFFKCCTCGTHIASSAFYYARKSIGTTGDGLGFDELVNVRTCEFLLCIPLEKDKSSPNDHLVYNVHCKVCDDHLGWEFTEENYDGVKQRGEGKYLLKRSRLNEVGGNGKGMKFEEGGSTSST